MYLLGVGYPGMQVVLAPAALLSSPSIVFTVVPVKCGWPRFNVLSVPSGEYYKYFINDDGGGSSNMGR